MNRYAIYFIFVSFISGICFFSGCSLYNHKSIQSSLNDSSLSENKSSFVFFNNSDFIATEYSELSDEKTEVLLGGYSLKGKSSAEELYAVFLYTDKTELHFQPEKRYTVSFDYRILDMGNRGFEIFFYSPSAASKHESVDSLIIDKTDSREGKGFLRCTLKNFDDYIVCWSILEGGAIVIDNINIFEENMLVSACSIEAERIAVNVNRKTIEKKIAEKSTVPVFCPLISCKIKNIYEPCQNSYNLVWTRKGLARDIESSKVSLSDTDTYLMQRDTDTLYLIAPDWHVWNPDRQTLSKRSAFYLNEVFTSDSCSEDSELFVINFEHRDWSVLMAEKASNYKKAGFDGLIFDCWNNAAGNGRNKKKVEDIRMNLLKEIREEVGDDFILAGNVHWNMDDPSGRYLSGVFAELRKPYAERTYAVSYADEFPENGYFSIERLDDFLHYWDTVLQWPKIIAVEAWTAADKSHMLQDTADSVNYENAKLLAAMTCVIPENGYFLYADMIETKPAYKHNHIYYDFYRTDFGKSISAAKNITEGVAYKEYEKGYIAYNRTSNPISFYTENGKELSLDALQGVFMPK